MPDMTHPAAKALAHAMSNPESYQPVDDSGSDEGGDIGGEVATPTATPTDPATLTPPPVVDPSEVLKSASLEDLMRQLKERAGETGLSKEEAIAADINAAMAKARQQEKDKLYSQVSSLKADLQAAQALNTQLTEATKSLTEKLKAGDAGDTAPKKKEGDSNVLTTEALTTAIEAAVDRTASEFQKQIDTLRAENQALQQSQRVKSVESYKRQLLDANKGAIIEELVTGDTPEALDESLTLAKQAYARIVTKLRANAEEPATPTATASVPPTPKVNQQTPASPTGSDPLTLDRFSENREKMLREASAAVKNALRGLSG